MSYTIVNIANIGSPPDDPALLLRGKLFVPDPIDFPPPWHCVSGTQASHFNNSENLSNLNAIFPEFAQLGFMCLSHLVRLTTPLPGQTTTGRWHQQTDDLKRGIRALRSNPFGLGYATTGFVGCLGGSGSAHHSLYCAIDGAVGDDKSDASICLSPPTDFSDRDPDDLDPALINIWQTYGDSTDLPTLRSRSPIGLSGLLTSSPILRYNGNAEAMPLSQKTRMDTAMIGNANDTSILNTGSLGTQHSFHMWTAIGADAKAWMLARAAAWSIQPQPPPPPPPPPPEPGAGVGKVLAYTPGTYRLSNYVMPGRSFPFRR